MHHGLPFNTINKIMIDFPQFDLEDEDKGLKEPSAAEFAASLNNFSLE